MPRFLMQQVHAISPMKVMSTPEFDPNYRFTVYETRNLMAASSDNESKMHGRRGVPVSEQSGETIFDYSQVPLHSGRAIRLVTIQPGPRETMIHCTLEAAELGAQNLKYEARSYTRGNASASLYSVRVNGAPFQVTNNLYCFLLRNRSEDARGHRTSWIDGICINQVDNGEKSKQLRLMKDIYMTAHSVRVWLDEETENNRRSIPTGTCAMQVDAIC